MTMINATEPWLFYLTNFTAVPFRNALEVPKNVLTIIISRQHQDGFMKESHWIDFSSMTIV